MLGYKPHIGAAVALGIIAFGGASIEYLNSVFTATTRWLFLLPILLTLFVSGRVLWGMRGAAGVMALVFLALSVASIAWSLVPNLSGPKATMFAISATTFSAAGAVWAIHCPKGHELRLFWPAIALALFAAIGGVAVEDALIQPNKNVELYRGITENSNFLAMLALGALPPALWEFYRPHQAHWQRLLGWSLAPLLGVIILTTFSRASILAALAVVVCFLLGTGLRRYALLLAGVLGPAMVAAVAFPDTLDKLQTLYVYKGAVDEDISVIFSRIDVWQESLDGARDGGAIGLGFGVSSGYTDFDGGLSSSEYGREKGNTALAVLEELGIAGFALYLGLLVLALWRIGRGAWRAQDPHNRVMLALIFGILTGLTINAQFEAWFLSPGAYLTPVFWTLFGLGLGLVDRYEHDGKPTAPQPQPRPRSRFGFGHPYG